MSDRSRKSEDKFSKSHVFVPEGLGSAERVALDGKSEIEGFITENGARQKVNIDEMSDDYTNMNAPWGREPSFKSKCAEIGVDYNRFIEALASGKSDQEIAEEIGIKPRAASNLRYHFETFGLDSVEPIGG